MKKPKECKKCGTKYFGFNECPECRLRKEGYAKALEEAFAIFTLDEGQTLANYIEKLKELKKRGGL